MEGLKRVWSFNDNLFRRVAHVLLGYTPTYTSFIAVPERPKTTLSNYREALQAARAQTLRSRKKSVLGVSGRNRPVRNFLNFMTIADIVEHALTSTPVTFLSYETAQ